MAALLVLPVLAAVLTGAAVLSGCSGGEPAVRPPVEPSEPSRRDTLTQPIAFARIHNYLSMATPLLWTRQADPIGVLGLALNACGEKDGYTDARERIAELVACARDLWRTAAEAKDDAERIEIGRATFKLIHLADVETVTAAF